MTIAVQSAYLESSQYKRWTYTKEDLAERRQKLNDDTIKTIQANFEEEEKLTGNAQRLVTYLSSDESLLVVNYFAEKILQLGSLFKVPSHLRATAATYFKRFYLFQSPMQYHPKSIMITSLFLATKTCEHHVSLDDFVKAIPKLTKEAVLEHEFLISSTIKFDFMHWSAYRPLFGFTLDMETVLVGTEYASDSGAAHDKAKATFNGCIWTDLPFLYSPSHLALAALLVVVPDMTKLYLEKKTLLNLLSSLEQIAAELKALSNYKFDRKEAEAVDKRLYHCSDPALKKGSVLYERAREAESNADMEKRRAKGQAAARSNEVMGEVLG